KVSPRTELYSMGIVAFEMLTGEIPFESDDALETMNMHLSVPPPAPSSVESSVPPVLDALILRLLEKEPANRPASAESVRRELTRIRRQFQANETMLVKGNAWPAPPAPAVAVRDPRLQPPHAK